MNYELAKELKEAKFPFDFQESKLGDDTYTFPSLEELIEACGEDLIAIQKTYADFDSKLDWDDAKKEKKEPRFMGWTAIKEWEDYYPPEVEVGEFGKTPSIAVARLWLALNKK